MLNSRLRASLGLVIVLTSLVGASPGAIAATAGSSFLVSATVLDICAVSATPMAFGNYSGASASPKDATGIISVTCTPTIGYSIALDAGTTVGGTVDARVMTDGNSHTLSYGLFTTNARDVIWGDGTNSTVTMDGNNGTGVAQNFTVYGRIPASQFIPAGPYTDTVDVTVTY